MEDVDEKQKEWSEEYEGRRRWWMKEVGEGDEHEEAMEE